MCEQERASKTRERGIRSIKQRRWPTIRSATKLGRDSSTAGRNQAAIAERQRELSERLSALRQSEIVVPHFQLTASKTALHATIVQITNGCAGYTAPVLSDIHLNLASGERLALTGGNGCRSEE